MFKYLMLLISFSALAQLNSPRSTFQTFLKSMVQVKKNVSTEQSYQKAFKAINPEFSGELDTRQKLICDELIKTFDKIEKVNYDNIPDQKVKSPWVYDKRNYKGKALSISVILNDKKQWVFSQDTLSSLDDYRDYFTDKDYVEGVDQLETFADKLRNKLPAYFQTNILFFEAWQWLGLLIYFIIAFIFEKLSVFIFRALLKLNFPFFKEHTEHFSEKVTRPLSKLLFMCILLFSIQYLDFKLSVFSFINKVLLVITTIVFIWLLKKIVEVTAFAFLEKSQASNSKFDDILVPLLAKTAYILCYIIGGVMVARNLGIDVTGIIAGLGIGGLAFAFAAKDTLANFFGSIMLVLDRPFDIGDVISAGDVEGVVLEVGFRSTRIRTFNDSLITISNGALVSRPIDNKGKRRYRRLNTTLGLEYSTPPKKIEAFCEGIRQIIISHKWTRKDNFNVYFTNFGASSLDITLVVYWETAEYARELSEKHRLMIDILRLAKDMQVSFAFPTQTLNLFTHKQQAEIKENDAYIDEGISLAKKVVDSPLSLKNPRSNLSEKDQFGDNDIGV